jgi:NAD(P)-dependent dehydrogenase (short-subunit alcohol dehydrogenase family)
MNRVAVVTGATAGIGRAVAVRVAGQGFRVIAVGRDEERGAAVVRSLQEAAPTSRYAPEHRFLSADLALMDGTAAVADAVSRHTDRVDAMVCCAGVFALRPEWTDEGLERTFALNYLSRFLLVRRLGPQLLRSPAGRVVLVANAGRYRDCLYLDDPYIRDNRRGIRVSARTQFANDLLAVELADRFRGTSVAATCVFPGVTQTDVFRNGTGVPRPLARLLTAVARRTGLTPDEAADTPTWLAGEADAAVVSASFFGPHRSIRRIPDRARRPDRRQALWDLSEELVAPWAAAMPAGLKPEG